MSKLTDLLHSWAIKPGHYADDFPSGGGSSAQVFELTNFAIPADTDYAHGFEMGTFVLPKDNGLVMAFYIETAAQPQHVLRLSIDDGPDYITSSTLQDQPLSGSVDTGGPLLVIARALDILAATDDQSAASHPAASRTMYVHLVKAPEPALVTVVRARVSVLLI